MICYANLKFVVNELKLQRKKKLNNERKTKKEKNYIKPLTASRPTSLEIIQKKTLKTSMFQGNWILQTDDRKENPNKNGGKKEFLKEIKIISGIFFLYKTMFLSPQKRKMEFSSWLSIKQSSKKNRSIKAKKNLGAKKKNLVFFPQLHHVHYLTT